MNNEAYIERIIEEGWSFSRSSFSNRYMNEKRYLSIQKVFSKYLKRKKSVEPIKVLEVATGNGWLVFRLGKEFSQKYNIDFSGIDLSPLDIEFALKKKDYLKLFKYEFKVMDARKLDFKEEEFDLVICSELIEHIVDPAVVLKEIRRVLKRGGLFIMTTPNKNAGLPTRLFRFLRKFFKSDNPARDLSSEHSIGEVGHNHVSVYARPEWVRLVRKEGFIVRSVGGTSGMFFGSLDFDKHRIIFAVSVILDVIFEKLPFSYLWSESLIFELEK